MIKLKCKIKYEEFAGYILLIMSIAIGTVNMNLDNNVLWVLVVAFFLGFSFISFLCYFKYGLKRLVVVFLFCLLVHVILVINTCLLVQVTNNELRELELKGKEQEAGNRVKEP